MYTSESQEILAWWCDRWTPCSVSHCSLHSTATILQLILGFQKKRVSFVSLSNLLGKKVLNSWRKSFISTGDMKKFGGWFWKGASLLAERIYFKTFAFLWGYLGLANASLDAGVMRWALRPKLHQLEHLVLDFSIRKNPRFFSCVLDEDAVGRLKKVTQHTHPRTLSVRALQHYAVAVCHLWVGK